MTEAEKETAAWLTGALEDRARLKDRGLDTTSITKLINYASAD